MVVYTGNYREPMEIENERQSIKIGRGERTKRHDWLLTCWILLGDGLGTWN